MPSIDLISRQADAFEFAKDLDEVALYCEQRTGKTFITMKIMDHVIDDHFCGFMVTLLSNKETTWIDKLAEYLPRLHVSDDWETFKALPEPRLFIVHFEAFIRVIDKMARYKRFNWGCIDESHKLGRRGTKQSKAAARMKWVDRKIILTGTPMEKDPSLLWSQFRFLAPGVFADRWDDFQDEFFDWVKLDIKDVPVGSARWKQKIMQQRILRNRATFKPHKADDIVRLIEPYAFRLEKEDVGIHRAKVIVRRVDMTAYQSKLYNRMNKRSVIRLTNGTRIMSRLPVTKVMKERQLASGFTYDDDGRLHLIDDPKIEEVARQFERMPKPVVIFSAFIPPIDRIHNLLTSRGYDGIVVTGKTPKKLRPDIWRSFQRAQYDYIVVQSRVGGAGNDLWKANNMIHHCLGHSFIDWDQSQSRIDAIDKTHKTKIVVICSRNTIDEEIHDLVVVKGLNGKQVLSRLKQRRRQMAKTKGAKAESKPATESKAPAAEAPKYGVKELSEALGIEPASVRVALRKSTLKRDGRSWGWDTKKEFDEAVKALKKSTDAATESKPAREGKKGRKSKDKADA